MLKKKIDKMFLEIIWDSISEMDRMILLTKYGISNKRDVYRLIKRDLIDINEDW